MKSDQLHYRRGLSCSDVIWSQNTLAENSGFVLIDFFHQVRGKGMLFYDFSLKSRCPGHQVQADEQQLSNTLSSKRPLFIKKMRNASFSATINALICLSNMDFEYEMSFSSECSFLSKVKMNNFAIIFQMLTLHKFCTPDISLAFCIKSQSWAKI